MIKLNWTYHLGRLLLWVLLALLLGLWAGHWLLVPSIFLAGYVAWQLFNGFRLHRWLQSWDTEPPESIGMWAEIFEGIASLQKLNRKRSRQYQQVIDDFTGMTDAFPDATLVIDRHDVINWFNDSAVRLLDLKAPADRGQTVTNLIRDPAFSDWLAVQDKLTSTLDITCPGDDNIILQLSAVHFGKDQRMLILRNVTDVRNLERMRRDLVANVSHELRTPLTVMLGYLEVLKSQPEEANSEAIERMFKQAGQMKDLIEDLLELSRLEDVEKQDDHADVDMPAMLAQLSEQAEDLSQGKHKIRFKIEPGLNLRGVEADLKSAFQNLISNAINYTPSKGQVRVSWQETDEGLVMAVADSGIGIPYRDIPRITERFYRVGDDRNRKTGGTGLGLAIVKHVLHSHDARLEIESVHGKG
ncbi:MAG: phosphate regulon sensor histidine kinase PhoR, partial [Gammaproteobacteria bacterium]|nr:phosphate regulon sensor histidine kinase PhoR [Gammaproteobacteria bacterium]